MNPDQSPTTNPPEEDLIPLVKRWRALINELERGYSNSLEKYKVELDVREKIETLIAETGNIRSKLLSELRVLDQRFRQVTFEPAWVEEDYETPWRRNLPRYAKGEIVIDIAELELEAAKNSAEPSKFTAVDVSGWPPHIWVFEGGHVASAAFTSKELADKWIAKHRLTGTLHAYPLNTGIYNWVVERGYFKLKGPHHLTPRVIQSWHSAYLPHFHYQFGAEVTGNEGKGL